MKRFPISPSQKFLTKSAAKFAYFGIQVEWVFSYGCSILPSSIDNFLIKPLRIRSYVSFLDRNRLGHIRRCFITDSPGRQEKQRYQSASTNLKEYKSVTNQYFLPVLIQKRKKGFLVGCKRIFEWKRLYLRIMMRSRTGTGPSSSLPALHSLQLGGIVELHHTIDLSVWMLMILAWVLLLTIHVDCHDTEVMGFWFRQTDFWSAIFGAVHFDCRDPAFVVS